MSQFLNVIESVFSGMARAIIHNSDYQSVEEAMQAIDRYFEERNEAFRENPRRAGKRYGGMSESPQFSPKATIVKTLGGKGDDTHLWERAESIPNQREKREMEARVKRLERLNKILFAGLALALLPWVVGAAEKIPELIEGANGKFQQVTLMGKKDGSNLVIKDDSGQIRIVLGFWKGHPSLVFAAKDGTVVATYAEKDGMFESVE